MSIYPSDRGRLELTGAAAGRALGILIAHGKQAAEPIAHLMNIRAQILRDMAPAVGAAGPGIPVLRQRNVEWAADELDTAAEIIRRLGNTVPRTAADFLAEEVAKAAAAFVHAEASGERAVIEDRHSTLLGWVAEWNENEAKRSRSADAEEETR